MVMVNLNFHDFIPYKMYGVVDVHKARIDSNKNILSTSSLIWTEYLCVSTEYLQYMENSEFKHCLIYHCK